MNQDEEPPDVVAGDLLVGTNRRGEVVLVLPDRPTGHIVFSPRQARQLASSLLKMADRAKEDRIIPLKPTTDCT